MTDKRATFFPEGTVEETLGTTRTHPIGTIAPLSKGLGPPPIMAPHTGRRILTPKDKVIPETIKGSQTLQHLAKMTWVGPPQSIPEPGLYQGQPTLQLMLLPPGDTGHPCPTAGPAPGFPSRVHSTTVPSQTCALITGNLGTGTIIL